MDSTSRASTRALSRAACAVLGMSESDLPRRRPALEQEAAQRGRTLGTQHADTLSAENALALSHLGNGRAQDCIDHLHRLAGDCAVLLGPDHPDTLVVRGNLAVARLAAGQGEEACLELTDVAARRARALGDDHPSTLNALLALALAQFDTGRADTAHRLLDVVQDTAERRHGKRHPMVRTCRALRTDGAAA